MRRLTTILLFALAVLAVVASSSWAGVPCVGTSDVWAASDTVHYETSVDVYVYVRDCYGEPLAYRTVTFYTDHAGDTFMGNPTVTDVTGFAQALMTSPCASYGEVSTLYCSSEGVELGGDFTVTWIGTAGLRDLSGTPAGFSLYGSSPNPFSEMAEMRYGMPREASVALEVYDIFGRRVKTLVDGSMGPGYHTAVWDGTDDRGRQVAPGVYYACMSASGFSETTKVMLLQ